MKYLILSIALFMLTACSDEQHPVDGEHVWKDQTDMIDKAKEVEQVITDSALEQKRQIEQNLD
jgi:outer membrane biogenesis lipoprotein LolB